MAVEVDNPPFGAFGMLDEDVDGRVLCHLCGRWFLRLGKHVNATHDWTVTEYQDTFGLKRSHSLASETYRDRMRAQCFHVHTARPPREQLLENLQRGRELNTLRDVHQNPRWLKRHSATLSEAKGGRGTVECAICGQSRHVHRKYLGKLTTCGKPACIKAYRARMMAEKSHDVEWAERRARALDRATAETIRARLAGGERGCDLAREYKVSRALVSLIKTGKIWTQDIAS